MKVYRSLFVPRRSRLRREEAFSVSREIADVGSDRVNVSSIPILTEWDRPKNTLRRKGRTLPCAAITQLRANITITRDMAWQSTGPPPPSLPPLPRVMIIVGSSRRITGSRIDRPRSRMIRRFAERYPFAVTLRCQMRAETRL